MRNWIIGFLFALVFGLVGVQSVVMHQYAAARSRVYTQAMEDLLAIDAIRGISIERLEREIRDLKADKEAALDITNPQARTAWAEKTSQDLYNRLMADVQETCK